MFEVNPKDAFRDPIAFLRNAYLLCFALFAGGALLRGAPTYTFEGEADYMVAIICALALLMTLVEFSTGTVPVHRTTVLLIRNRVFRGDEEHVRRHIANDVALMLGHIAVFVALAMLCWQNYQFFWIATNVLIGVNLVWIARKLHFMVRARTSKIVSDDGFLRTRVDACLHALTSWLMLNAVFLMASPLLAASFTGTSRWVYLLPGLAIVLRAIVDFCLARGFYSDAVMGRFKRTRPSSHEPPRTDAID